MDSILRGLKKTWHELKELIQPLFDKLPAGIKQSIGDAFSTLGSSALGGALGNIVSDIFTDPSEKIIEATDRVNASVQAFHKDAEGLLAKIAGVENPITKREAGG